MPRDRNVRGSANDWLARAKGDLAIARAPLPEGAFLEDLCYHAQQAAEKALKALYVHRGATFRYTHDLGELIAGLGEAGVMVPPEMEEAAGLTTYAWEARYPGPAEPVSAEEYESARESAERVVEWSAREIKSPATRRG